MTTYDRLHRQCRTLENLFDSKLTTYAQLAATLAQPEQDVEASGSSNRWKDLEQELDDLLLKVRTYTRMIGWSLTQPNSWKKSTNSFRH